MKQSGTEMLVRALKSPVENVVIEKISVQLGRLAVGFLQQRLHRLGVIVRIPCKDFNAAIADVSLQEAVVF